ncbi:hypothetical protein N7449_007425 [Penicillium cf. viridicatum]|uniref:Uncharacterized protein n=1 Tax=Penicillium cf. viridicatum TaxID=2972119 RepID=A0A9W9MBH2_9EURO|nr:hypothetical protein N7449_007425 [Penicillium cf. viridicatum]
MSAHLHKSEVRQCSAKTRCQLGIAEYTVTLDGGLVDRHGNCHAIIEDKARPIGQKEIRALLMQQGLEMLAWIITSLVVYRWTMLIQCGTDMYMIAADVPQEYLEYLAQGTKSCNPLKPDIFLNMHLLGPLNILSKGHMDTFGFLVVALTMIQNQDWGKKGGDKETPV